MRKKKTRLLPMKEMRFLDSLHGLYREMDDRGMFVPGGFEEGLRHDISEMIGHPVRCPGCTERNRKVRLEEPALSSGVADIHLKTSFQLYREIYDLLALEIIETMRSELKKKIKVKSAFVDIIS